MTLYSVSAKGKATETNLHNILWLSVTNNRGQSSIETVVILNIDKETLSKCSQVLYFANRSSGHGNQIRMFTFEHVPYVLNEETENFERLKNLDEISTTNDLLQSNRAGVTDQQRDVL